MTTVLDRVVAEMQSANGPVRLGHLAARVGVAESALRGMIDLLVHKGILIEPSREIGPEGFECSSGACGTTCVGLSNCPFVAQTPTSYSVAVPAVKESQVSDPGLPS